MAPINMHMKFEIEIPKQTWLMLRKPCRLQTDGRTDGRMDGQGESRILPPTSLGEGIMMTPITDTLKCRVRFMEVRIKVSEMWFFFKAVYASLIAEVWHPDHQASVHFSRDQDGIEWNPLIPVTSLARHSVSNYRQLHCLFISLFIVESAQYRLHVLAYCSTPQIPSRQQKVWWRHAPQLHWGAFKFTVIIYGSLFMD